MKIAIDITPIQGTEQGHKVRGVGFYLEHLKISLLKYFPEHQYIFFTQSGELSNDVDVVHYPYFDPFFFTLPLSKKFKTVVTVHDLTPLVFPQHFPAGIKGKLRWQIQKYKLRNVSAIITDSHTSQKDIIKLAGVPESHVDVAYLAAGETYRKLKKQDIPLEKLKEKYHLPDNFILYVGDVTWNKNLPRFITAVKQLQLPLVMVGKILVEKSFDKAHPWNKDLVEVQKLVEGDPNIVRLGFVPSEDLVYLYNMAKVFVFPSVYEGFGLPIVEAMQCGCPVVTTHGGSLSEVAGDAAIYVDGYDVQNMANGIQEVYTDEKLQKDLVEKGLVQSQKFSWKKTVEETMRVYRKVLV